MRSHRSFIYVSNSIFKTPTIVRGQCITKGFRIVLIGDQAHELHESLVAIL